MNSEQMLNSSPPRYPSATDPALRAAEEHRARCWLRLVEHAKTGRCTCSLGVGGSVHILAGCATGRMLWEEYVRAADEVRELTPKLEAGDFDGRDPEPVL